MLSARNAKPLLPIAKTSAKADIDLDPNPYNSRYTDPGNTSFKIISGAARSHVSTLAIHASLEVPYMYLYNQPLPTSSSSTNKMNLTSPKRSCLYM